MADLKFSSTRSNYPGLSASPGAEWFCRTAPRRLEKGLIPILSLPDRDVHPRRSVPGDSDPSRALDGPRAQDTNSESTVRL